MAPKKSLTSKILILSFLLALSLILITPNFAIRTLQIAFQDYSYGASSIEYGGKKIADDQIQDFLRDRDNGLGYFFPDKDCKLLTENSSTSAVVQQTRCLLEDRFITSVKINSLIQAFPDMIDERETKLVPHFFEQVISDILDRPKQLAIKLGLDLQGGMRIVMRADFDSYISRIEEKIAVLSAQQKQANQNLDDQDLENRIQTLTSAKDLDLGERDRLLEESKDILVKRLAAQNITEAEIRSNSQSDSITIDLPGVAKANEVLEKIKNTVSVEYRIVDQELTDKIMTIEENRNDLEFLKNQAKAGLYDLRLEQQLIAQIAKRSNVETRRIFLFWRRPYATTENPAAAKLLPRDFRVLGPPELDGSDMESAFASASIDGGGWYQISFRLTNFGSKKFGTLTEKNRGNQLAILWGRRVISDPVIREPIYGGNGVINGSFSQSEAQEIASVIREGALPMPLEIISINSIGPSLGLAAIQSGMIAILLSFFIIMVFLLFYYRWWGINAILVIFLNLLILFAVMSFLGFTFTLPGFAGIVLTLGIAIDASVIIFERLKEELLGNHSFQLAVERGFQSSFWTILDANITTMIAAIILWLPRDGPIMGFAIVLFFGLLVSMYTSLTVSRLFFDILIRRKVYRLPAMVVKNMNSQVANQGK